MKNILYYNANVKPILHSDIIRNIALNLDIQESYVVVGSLEAIKNYQPLKCIWMEDTFKSNYQNYKFFGEMIPVDDAIFNQIQPFFLEIMRIKQRFVKHFEYHLPCTLEYHYESLMKDLQYWNYFLEQGKIKYIVSSEVPHRGNDNLLYHLCKIKNIPIISLSLSVLPVMPRRYFIIDDYKSIGVLIQAELETLKKYYCNKNINEIKLAKHVENYFEDMSSLDFTLMKKSSEVGSSLEKMFIRNVGETSIIKYTIRASQLITNRYDSVAKKIYWLIRNIPGLIYTICKQLPALMFAKKMWVETKKLHRVYKKISQEPMEEKYIYYAMHCVPELTSAPLGGGLYFDQRIPIRILAKSMPEGWKLYVKLHPAQTANMCSEEVIREINKIDNVKLIDEKYHTYEIVQKAQAISTLTGTVAWEAQFLGVPSILFGYSEKNVAPLSYHARTVDECRKAIDSIVKKEKNTDIRELKIFVKALENVSFDREDRAVLQEKLIDALKKFDK